MLWRVSGSRRLNGRAVAGAPSAALLWPLYAFWSKPAEASLSHRDRLPLLLIRASSPPYKLPIISSVVLSFGILIVLLMAPDMNGWTAAIIFRCAMIMDIPFAVARLKSTIKNRQMVRIEFFRTFDGLIFIYVIADRFDVVRRCSRAAREPSARFC